MSTPAELLTDARGIIANQAETIKRQAKKLHEYRIGLMSMDRIAVEDRPDDPVWDTQNDARTSRMLDSLKQLVKLLRGQT